MCMTFLTLKSLKFWLVDDLCLALCHWLKYVWPPASPKSYFGVTGLLIANHLSYDKIYIVISLFVGALPVRSLIYLCTWCRCFPRRGSMSCCQLLHGHKSCSSHSTRFLDVRPTLLWHLPASRQRQSDAKSISTYSCETCVCFGCLHPVAPSDYSLQRWE